MRRPLLSLNLADTGLPDRAFEEVSVGRPSVAEAVRRYD
jgi:hypothetical protein